jgi:hypothetical protein
MLGPALFLSKEITMIVASLIILFVAFSIAAIVAWRLEKKYKEYG